MMDLLSSRMSVRTYAACAVFALGTVFSLSLFLRYQEEQTAADAFFSSVLHMMGTHETVVVRGEALRIIDGKVETENGTAAFPSAERKALRIAYARALARRDPILGIPGNDPRFLAESVNQLSEVMDALVKKQTSAQDASSVRSMYPIRFLQSLAALEESRIAFIESGSDADELAYRAALSRTLAAGRFDSTSLDRALAVVAAGEEMRFQGFGGPISIRSMRDATRSIETQFGELENQARRLDMCLGGDVDSCYPSTLVVDRAFTEFPKETPRVSGSARSRIREVTALYAQTTTKRASPVFTDGTPIVLTQSTCLSELPPPYVVLLGGTSPWGIAPIWYVADIYFSPTKGSDAVILQYLAENHDIHYGRINPMMFYTCPDMGVDLAKAWAVRSTAEFALEHPEVAPTHRERLLSHGDIWYESDAYAYMRAALAETPIQRTTLTVREELEFVALLWNRNGVGLDGVLASIVRTESNRLDMYERGVPFDVSAKTNLLTRSAIPTLLLSDGQSIDILHAQSGTDIRASDFLTTLTTYGDMRNIVPHARIVHDLREFLIFEGVSL
ncbi:MAG: hypothetical protein Athens041674_532 [Parcubacteria group bacterium Athens0416_74]|nr:MAG: hypothetical protein Athens041674_532 [Parcubacteria group bacterium Athens0416_74]